MVDPSKIKDRMKEREEEEVKSKPRKKKKRVEEIGDKRETRSDKMNKLKKGMGHSGVEDTPDDVKRSDVSLALECLGNMTLNCEGKMRAKEDPDNPREDYQHRISKTMFEEFTDTISKRNIQAICERYGVDWKDDVLRVILEKSSESKSGAIDLHKGGVDKGNVSLGGGEKVDKSHFLSVLNAIGEIFLFTRLIHDKVTEGDSRQENMVEDMVDDMMSEQIKTIGSFNIEEVSNRYGISWQGDVLDHISGDVG